MSATHDIGCATCHERAGRTRGLCPACYDRLRADVRDGKTTWPELEAAGLARPARRPGPLWRQRWR